MTFIECVNIRYVNCNAWELYNLYMHVTPDPSPLCEGVGHPDLPVGCMVSWALCVGKMCSLVYQLRKESMIYQ